MENQLGVIRLHCIAFEMLRFGKRQLQVFRELTREVIATDRDASLPNTKTIGYDQIAGIGTNRQDHRRLLWTVWVKRFRRHALLESIVSDHVVDAHRCQLHQIDIQRSFAIRL